MWRRNRKQCLFAKNDGKRSQNPVRLSELFVVLMKVGVVLGFYWLLTRAPSLDVVPIVAFSQKKKERASSEQRQH